MNSRLLVRSARKYEADARALGAIGVEALRYLTGEWGMKMCDRPIVIHLTRSKTWFYLRCAPIVAKLGYLLLWPVLAKQGRWHIGGAFAIPSRTWPSVALSPDRFVDQKPLPEWLTLYDREVLQDLDLLRRYVICHELCHVLLANHDIVGELNEALALSLAEAFLGQPVLIVDESVCFTSAEEVIDSLNGDDERVDKQMTYQQCAAAGRALCTQYPQALRDILQQR